MSFAQLNTEGFLFTQTGLPVSLLKGSFGDGYDGPAAVIGSPHGLRGWSVKIGVLPDAEGRATYLWNFMLASKRAGNEAFWIADPKDNLFYLAEFIDDELSFDVLRSKAYATGLQLRQRRDRIQESPVTVIPGGPARPDWPEFGKSEFGN